VCMCHISLTVLHIVMIRTLLFRFFFFFDLKLLFLVVRLSSASWPDGSWVMCSANNAVKASI
jgi:hypothetical protein